VAGPETPPRRATADLQTGEAALLASAAAAVGLAVHLRDGQYTVPGLCLIAVALAATGAAVLGRAPRLTSRALTALLAVLVAGQLALLFAGPVALEMEPGGRGPFLALLGAAAAVLAVLIVDPRWLGWGRPAAIALFVALYLAAGVWLLRHAPPGTDVFNFQRGALEAFRHGRDPYSIKFRNIYHPYEGFYGPGLVVRGVLQFGYPYPPLPLFLTAAALPLGDIRYAHLAALAAAGALLAGMQRGRLGPLAAGLLLFSPRVGLLLQMSWTEPFVIALCAATVVCARRAPRLLPVALGLLLASKQYLFLCAPAALLLVPEGPDRARRAVRLLLVAAAVAAAITLPLALWDLPAFLRSAVTLQLRQPFRMDALSFATALARAGGPQLGWLPLVLGPAALAVAVPRAARTPAGFALVVGFAYLVFFAVSKQAFCNYYFFPIGALCAAVAGADAWTQPGFAGRSPSRGGLGTLPGSPSSQSAAR
jgi:hypothetical protein